MKFYEVSNEPMKFYETTKGEYYALIKAASVEQAEEIYYTDICNDPPRVQRS